MRTTDRITKKFAVWTGLYKKDTDPKFYHEANDNSSIKSAFLFVWERRILSFCRFVNDCCENRLIFATNF